MYTFKDDFEDGNLTGWSNTTAATTVIAAAAHDGSLGMRQAPDGTLAGVASLSDTTLPNDYDYADVRFWFRQVSHTTGNSSVVTVENRTGSDHADLFINYSTDSRLSWDVNVANFGKADIVLGQWYYVRVVVFFGGTSWTMRVWLDGVEQTQVTTSGKTASDVRAIHFGGFASNVNTRDYDGIEVYLSETDPTLPKFGRIHFANMETPAAPGGRIHFAKLALPGMTTGRVHWGKFSAPVGSLATGAIHFAALKIPASPEAVPPSGLYQLASNGAWWNTAVRQRTSNDEWV